jgi:hypothetical protein
LYCSFLLAEVIVYPSVFFFFFGRRRKQKRKERAREREEMFRLSRAARSSRYTPIVGCAFLVETLYGSKYSANLGAYSMPYVYVKTILLCATGHGLELREGRYIHGLIELLLPSKVSQDNLTKLELLQFVDAIPMDRMLEGHVADPEEEAEMQATMALISNSGAVEHPPRRRQQQQRAHCTPSFPSWNHHSRAESGEHDSNADVEWRHHEDDVGGGSTDGEGHHRSSREEEDAAAIESIMSFVSPATFPSSMARVLIYDAVCTCVADGLYSAKEKERVALVSSHIGLSTAVRGQIEKLALQEKVLSIRKRRLLLLQQPSLPHAPLREERMVGQGSSDVEGHPNSSSGAAEQHHASCSHVRTASGEAQAHSGATAVREEGCEEARKIEAARALLRRARRRQQKHSFFAAA